MLALFHLHGNSAECVTRVHIDLLFVYRIPARRFLALCYQLAAKLPTMSSSLGARTEVGERS